MRRKPAFADAYSCIRTTRLRRRIQQIVNALLSQDAFRDEASRRDAIDQQRHRGRSTVGQTRADQRDEEAGEQRSDGGAGKKRRCVQQMAHWTAPRRVAPTHRSFGTRSSCARGEFMVALVTSVALVAMRAGTDSPRAAASAAFTPS